MTKRTISWCLFIDSRCIFTCIGYIFSTDVEADELSKCYQVNSKNYCFYTNSSVLSWDEAREFCARRNSTLPIITDEDVDNVFQQFIVSDSYSLIQNRPVWIAAHARPVNNSVRWHWIDGQPSGNDNTHCKLCHRYLTPILRFYVRLLCLGVKQNTEMFT